MTTQQFFQELGERIAKYDLLCHPFYKAWSTGQLTRDDLREYAKDYFHHVEAFPAYLGEFADRLEDGKLRRAVIANMNDE
jgi:pyrroloquinoline-quinone synthase